MASFASEEYDVRIVRVREDENFPEPHVAFSVVGFGLERVGSKEYEGVWDVALFTPRASEPS